MIPQSQVIMVRCMINYVYEKAKDQAGSCPRCIRAKHTEAYLAHFESNMHMQQCTRLCLGFSMRSFSQAWLDGMC